MGSVFGRHFSPEVVRRYDSPDEVADVLGAACAAGAKATICGAMVPKPVHGAFVAIERDQVILRCPSSGLAEIGPRSLCTVVFTHNGRQSMFFSVFVGQPRSESGECRLALRVPKSIDEIEARWNRRIQVGPETPIQATIVGPAGAVVQARVLDLGRGGADLAVDGPSLPWLTEGDWYQLHLETPTASAHVTAELRWRMEARHGFCFEHYHDREVLNVPQALEALLRSLEAGGDSQAA